MKTGYQVPRSRTLLAITAQAIAAGQLAVLTFATHVADLYLERTPSEHRVVKFRPMVGDTDQLLATQRHNAQIVDRYIKGLVKAFPADLEEVWMECLPPPFREQALRELAARVGLLPARLPSGSPRQQLQTFRELMSSFGAAFESSTPVFADGRVDEDDAPHLARAVRDIDDHVAKCIAARTEMVAVQERLSLSTGDRG